MYRNFHEFSLPNRIFFAKFAACQSFKLQKTIVDFVLGENIPDMSVWVIFQCMSTYISAVNVLMFQSRSSARNESKSIANVPVCDSHILELSLGKIVEIFGNLSIFRCANVQKFSGILTSRSHIFCPICSMSAVQTAEIIVNFFLVVKIADMSVRVILQCLSTYIWTVKMYRKFHEFSLPNSRYQCGVCSYFYQ